MTKIAVATPEGGLDDQVSSVFGRCGTYTIVETEGQDILEVDVIQNEYSDASSGAGIQAAGLVAKEEVSAVIAGNFGPNVISVLNESNVEMVPASNLSVRKAVQKYIRGELQPVDEATTQPKAGYGGGMNRSTRRKSVSQNNLSGKADVSSSESKSDRSPNSQVTKDERIENLENQIGYLEDQLGKIMEALESLKEEQNSAD